MARNPDLYHWNCFLPIWLLLQKSCCRWAGEERRPVGCSLAIHWRTFPVFHSLSALWGSRPEHPFLFIFGNHSCYAAGEPLCFWKELEPTWKPIKWHHANQVHFSCRQWRNYSGCTAATRSVHARRTWNTMSSSPLHGLGIWSCSTTADWRYRIQWQQWPFLTTSTVQLF